MNLAIAMYADGMPQGTASRLQTHVPATRLGADPDAGPVNLQPFQTMPLTRVNPVVEQGRGRAPGQQWPHMPHSVILNFASLGNMNRHTRFSSRAELERNTGRWMTWQQAPAGYHHGAFQGTPAVLANPNTVVYAAAGGEPL